VSVALADIFQIKLASGSRGEMEGVADLEGVLSALVTAASARWPDIHMDARWFVEAIAEAVAGEPDPAAALIALNAPDLFLTRACAAGDVQALAHFDAALLPEVDAAAAAMQAPAAVAQEARQIVSQKLLVSGDGQRAHITDYTGRGPLRTWFRVIATRTVISLLRKERRLVPVSDDAFVAMRALDDDPELMLVKSTYRREAKFAFAGAVQGLDVRGRNLLKHQLVDGLTVEEIARIYRVHRVTVARWLAAARRDVWRSARRTLEERLRMEGSDLHIVLRQIRSQLDLSLERVLLGPADQAGAIDDDPQGDD